MPGFMADFETDIAGPFGVARGGVSTSQPSSWNPNDKSGSPIFTVGNLAYTQSTGNAGCRATKSAGSGKLYFEVRAFPNSPNTFRAGLAPAALNLLANAIGNDATSIAASDNGAVLVSNGSVQSFSQGSVLAGDILGFCCDLDQRKLYVSQNGVFGTGVNPLTGIGGASIPSPIVFPATTLYNTGESIILNTGAPFLFPIPNGFSPWG